MRKSKHFRSKSLDFVKFVIFTPKILASEEKLLLPLNLLSYK